jgi:hypothetical protein
MVSYRTDFVQDKETMSKCKMVGDTEVNYENHLDDDAMSADTSCGDCFQSSREDGSQGDFDEVPNANCDSWKTNSFWDDSAVDEVAPRVETVPVVVNALVPSTDVYSAEAVSQLLRQAEDFKIMAAQLENKASKLKDSAFDYPNENLVAQGTSEVVACQAHDGRTTVMLRNIPNNVTRADLLDGFASQGFQFSFDFVYLPMDFKRDANLGYAFVNLLSEEVADRFYESFHGFSNWGHASNKVSEVTWGSIHGLNVHVERYRNSPVMHDSVPDENKPVIFREGQRVPFPPPTKRLRAPRMK